MVMISKELILRFENIYYSIYIYIYIYIYILSSEREKERDLSHAKY